MKTTDLVAPIFEKAGRVCDQNPRQRYRRMVNKLLNTGLFEVTLCEKGKHWTKDKDGKPYNLCVRMKSAGKRYCRFERSGISCLDIMIGIGRLLQTDEAKVVVSSYVDISLKCQRCAHQEIPGYIRMFAHVCDGICFECYGTGFTAKKLTVEIDKIVSAPAKGSTGITIALDRIEGAFQL